MALLGGSQSAFDAAVRGERAPSSLGAIDAIADTRTVREAAAADHELIEHDSLDDDGPGAGGEAPQRFRLHEACYHGDLERVRALLGRPSAQRPDGPQRHATGWLCGRINELNDGAQGFPPLHAAVLSGDERIVCALLQAGATVDALSADGLTALQVAVGAGELACTRALLDANAAVNWLPPPADKAATAEGDVRGRCRGGAMKDSAAAAAEVGVGATSGVAWVDGGVSVLHTACAAGHSSIVRLLLERGASSWAVLSDPKQRGATPLAVAAQAGHADCVRLFLDDNLISMAPPPLAQAREGISGQPQRAATTAAKSGASHASKPAAAAKLERAGAPLTASNGQSSTPPATIKSKAAVAAAPVIDIPTTAPLALRLVAMPMADGRTPLHLACEHGAAETAGLLIGVIPPERCELIDLPDASGLSPLDHACQSGQLEAVKLLLEAGAAWRREGSLSGSTALHVAVAADQLPCALALLEAKANPEQPDNAGRSPLLLASELGQTECALAMLSMPHLAGVPYLEVGVDVWRAWVPETFAGLGRERAARAAVG